MNLFDSDYDYGETTDYAMNRAEEPVPTKRQYTARFIKALCLILVAYESLSLIGYQTL